MEEPRTVGVPLDAHGDIAIDIQCRKCGYNLRGLREDMHCPECGTPVGLSTHGDMLRYADPDWVATVARGITIILWMIPIGVLVGCGAGLLQAGLGAGGARMASGGTGPGAPTSLPLVGIIVLLARLASYYGVWLMTEPDPSRIGVDPNMTARKVVRIALVFGIIGEALQLIPGTSVTPSVALVLTIAMVVVGLIGLVGQYAKYIFYEKLALRIPDAKLARTARIIRNGLVISLGAVLVGVVVAAVATAGVGLAAAAAPLVCLTAPAGIGVLVFSVWTIILLLRLRKAMVEQARLARETWAAAMQPGASAEF